MGSKYVPSLSEATELALREVTELASGYPVDIWASRNELQDLDPRYYGLDIPPAWDYEWGEIPPELFDRWVMVFWEFSRQARHPSTQRIANDFGLTRNFVDKMRAHVAMEAKRKLPDNYIAVVRRQQALSLQKVVDHSMKKLYGEYTGDPDSDDVEGDRAAPPSDKVKIEYGKLGLAAMKRQAELLGLDMPKDPTSITLTQLNDNRVQVGEETARKFGVKSMDQLREIGNQIAARMAEVEMADADAGVVDAEIVGEVPSGGE